MKVNRLLNSIYIFLKTFRNNDILSWKAILRVTAHMTGCLVNGNLYPCFSIQLFWRSCESINQTNSVMKAGGNTSFNYRVLENTRILSNSCQNFVLNDLLISR